MKVFAAVALAAVAVAAPTKVARQYVSVSGSASASAQAGGRLPNFSNPNSLGQLIQQGEAAFAGIIAGGITKGASGVSTGEQAIEAFEAYLQSVAEDTATDAENGFLAAIKTIETAAEQAGATLAADGDQAFQFAESQLLQGFQTAAADAANGISTGAADLASGLASVASILSGFVKNA